MMNQDGAALSQRDRAHLDWLRPCEVALLALRGGVRGFEVHGLGNEAGAEGARQVGKSYLVEDLERRHFKSVLTVDLERERELHSLFSQSDPVRLLEELALLKRLPLVPGETLLFLDEIQAYAPALAALRYFFERIPELHVVAAGSLLDFILREFSHSMPVALETLWHRGSATTRCRDRWISSKHTSWSDDCGSTTRTWGNAW
jgi:hypothetical protein